MTQPALANIDFTDAQARQNVKVTYLQNSKPRFCPQTKVPETGWRSMAPAPPRPQMHGKGRLNR
jgi:hypothetical protein